MGRQKKDGKVVGGQKSMRQEGEATHPGGKIVFRRESKGSQLTFGVDW